MDAKVVYCPINTERFFSADVEPEDFYVAFSRLVPYKRIDLAVSACKKLGRRLVVIGAGSEMENLKKLAGNDKNIQEEQKIQKCAHIFSVAELLFFARKKI